MRWRNALLGHILLVALASPSLAAEEDSKLARRIDERLAERWAEAKVQPVGRSEDAEFLRRVTLDLTGKVPSVGAVRRFLADRSPNKRRDQIERLLEGPGYVNHFRNLWRDRLQLDPEADARRLTAVAEMDHWLEQQLANNVPFDRMVRSLLTLPLAENRKRSDREEALPVLFYLGREDKPEALAAGVTRLFLGVRLECAQCHDHPHAPWSREVFWSQAAFFAGLRDEASAPRKISIPGVKREVAARFLDNTPLPEGGSGRAALARWITGPDNPFFARAAVNRLWDHFFGIGLVDPVDDMTAANRPSHPELLDDLARAFVAARYDVKVIIRAILLSDAYQRTSVESRPGAPPEPRLFSRMSVEALTGADVFDSLIEATGYRPADLANRRGRFLARFGRVEQRLAGQGSIPRSLALMNGELVTAALRPDSENTLSAVIASPFLDTAGQVETLYLAAYGRPPRPEEKERMVKLVSAGETLQERDRALGDVFWALLNSAEFLHNH